jgi:hypothetical protein
MIGHDLAAWIKTRLRAGKFVDLHVANIRVRGLLDERSSFTRPANTDGQSVHFASGRFPT